MNVSQLIGFEYDCSVVMVMISMLMIFCSSTIVATCCVNTLLVSGSITNCDC